jgi:cytochrome c oxidase assembly protein subunit 15
MTPNPVTLRHDRQVGLWLAACAAVIFGMILLGGVTRLTESGLSMVEWRPLMGVIPPLTEADWQATFDKYRQYPEYRLVNQGMTLDGFKVIFMYEYLHRMLGRLIGLLFALPLLWFALRGRLRAGLMPKLLLLFLLGGCQGFLGWYMVQSGLVDRPDVSQYRLTAHLGLAVAIYGYMLWLVLGLLAPAPGRSASPLAPWALGLVGLVYLMILSGGLVAGTNAGYAWSTWPRMGPTFVPEGLYAMTPAWLAAFEDVTTIQFNHRLFAYLITALVAVLAAAVLHREASPQVRRGAWLLLGALGLQVTLGITTLLNHVPVPLAAAHQAGAVLLLSCALYLAWGLRGARPAQAL